LEGGKESARERKTKGKRERHASSRTPTDNLK